MGTVAVEEWPGAIGSTCHFRRRGCAIQASESRDIGFVTRELPLTRVNHLAAALAQLRVRHLWGVRRVDLAGPVWIRLVLSGPVPGCTRRFPT